MTSAGFLNANVQQPAVDNCRGQLRRILDAAGFDATDRERRFLEYIVEETLAGRGDRIKAYAIAIEVFGRDSAFDQQNDPIVRIAASHLRRSLERYYLTTGRSDAILITIPKGGYLPKFAVRSALEESPPSETGEDKNAPGPDHGDGFVRSIRPPPEPADIRAQLERIVSSTDFHCAGRGAAFLHYIVEEALAGRGHRIKGYSIAIEVFKRDQGFPQDDPVVRMEAARLRRALERYYLVAGQDDPVTIDVPKGGYVPTFRWNAPLPATPETAVIPDATDVPVMPDATEPAGMRATPEPAVMPDATAPAIASSRYYRGILMAGLVAMMTLCLAYLTIDRLGYLASDTVSETDGPTLVIAPFANLGEGPNTGPYALGLTEELLTALPRFKEIKVFGRETSKLLSPDVDVSQIRAQLGARYLLAGGVRTSGSRIRVTARLLDTADGAILWSQDYDNDLVSRDLFAIQSDVSAKVATAIAQPYGIMARVDTGAPPPDDLNAYRCTLNFYAYRSELSAERHAEARECLENAVARHPSYSTAWAMLSITYLDEDRFKFNPKPGTSAPIQRAVQAARRGNQLDPNNTRGLQALMMALFFNAQFPEAMRLGEQALAMNPNDTELMGEFGTRLAMGGQWQRGAALLDRALALNPGGAGYYHGTRGLSAYMLGDTATAVAEIKQADLQKFPLFHIVAAIIYGEAGMAEEARLAGETFMRLRPDFLPNIEAELTMRNIRPEDQAQLISGMLKAGLPLPHGVQAAIAESGAGVEAP